MKHAFTSIAIFSLASTSIMLGASAARKVAPVVVQDSYVYEGRLTSRGKPYSGLIDVKVSVFDEAVGGTPVELTQRINGVAVLNGNFRVPVEFRTLSSNAGERWIEIAVRTPRSKQFITMKPRQLIGGTTRTDGKRMDGADDNNDPQPLMFGNRNMITTGSLLMFFDSDNNSTTEAARFLKDGATAGTATELMRIQEDGNVGIGITDPVAKLEVGATDGPGILSIVTGAGAGMEARNDAMNGITRGLNAEVNSPTGIGVFARANATTGSAKAIRGESLGEDGIGVEGFVSSSTGGAIGVQGIATGNSGATVGVRGESKSSVGDGVEGVASHATGGGAGVRGVAEGTAGRGVSGSANAETGETIGVYGESASSAGVGVSGEVLAETGNTIGVKGLSLSSAGVGVRGKAIATTGTATGVWGSSSSTQGWGVRGEATALSGSTFGVLGSSSSSSGMGVWGTASASSGATTGVYGSSHSTSGKGVVGVALASSGGAVGVRGESASNAGVAVQGQATSATGSTIGVYGTTTSGDGIGVYGITPRKGVFGKSTDNNSGIGVHGVSAATSGDGYGVLGETSSPDSWGVRGKGTMGGIKGSQTQPGGIAVRGQSTATSGFSFGIYGSSDSSSGRGVFGGNGSGGRGVMGFSSGGEGGFFTASGTGGRSLVANNSPGSSSIIIAAQADFNDRFLAYTSGNCWCAGMFIDGGGDYAELMQQVDPDETLEPGDVVGVFDGKVTRNTQGAQRIMVVSTEPALVGKHPKDAGDGAYEGAAIIGFIGQVPVKVLGPVSAGDVLLASNNNDGLAIAMSPADITSAHLNRVIGTAWESVGSAGINVVNTAIGVDQVRAAAGAIATLEKRADETQAQIESLHHANDDLRDRIAALEKLLSDKD